MKYFLAIIGGGPAGYTAAEKASKAGKDVVLFEQNAVGGTCLNVGCIPTKSLLYGAKQYYNATHAQKYGVTGVMQPFVRSPQDLKDVRNELAQAGAQGVRLFAKIENTAGIEQVDALIPWADEIVIARGDLGNAVRLWELPAVQKRIAAACRAAGRDFMVVTQMLASMEHRAVPTRAEVSDIFNAVLDGATSVMVTGETAIGKHPVEVIRYLSKTAGEALKDRQR